MKPNQYNSSRPNLFSESLSHNKPKFVILGYPYFGMKPAAENYGALMAKIPDNKLLRFLLRVHMSYKLNSIVDIPCKSIWDNELFDTEKISPDEEVYFLVSDCFPTVFSRNYLHHLRRKYKHCKLILFFLNPIAGPELGLGEKWKRVKSYYDLGITMNRADAEKHDLMLCQCFPHVLPDKDFQPENASDVFFCGAAKDRLPKILEVYERLTDAGLKCEFYITGVPERQQKYSQYIHYTETATNHWLSYDEICQKDRNTKCVLEILPFGQNYASLRVTEALWYHKKLLTTNIEAPQEYFYHPEIVQCFSNARDIDTEFITRPLSAEDEQIIFGQRKIPDFETFANWIIENAG